MKRSLSIILIFIALTNIVGFMPLYFSALQEIKGEVELKMATNYNLQAIRITRIEYNDPSIFHNTDDNEFSYRGRMYDYKTVKKTGTDYVFYALEDNKESNLIDFLKSAYEQSGQDSKNSKAPFGNLLKNFSKDFVGCASTQILMPPTNLSRLSLLVSKGTCTGYCRLLQNPPDSNC